jgi:hypothetical protein
MGRLIIAPEYVDFDSPLIFLAGPIQGAQRWQDQAVKLIWSYDAGINIANPRRTSESYTKGDFTPEMYNEQVDWETHYLRLTAKKNGVVLFWLAREDEHSCHRAYAQTSRFELAEWKAEHMYNGTKLAIGVEQQDGKDLFTGSRYIRRRMSQDCPEVPIFSTLEETCSEAVRLANHSFLNGPST